MQDLKVFKQFLTHFLSQGMVRATPAN